MVSLLCSVTDEFIASLAKTKGSLSKTKGTYQLGCENIVTFCARLVKYSFVQGVYMVLVVFMAFHWLFTFNAGIFVFVDLVMVDFRIP